MSDVDDLPGWAKAVFVTVVVTLKLAVFCGLVFLAVKVVGCAS